MTASSQPVSLRDPLAVTRLDAVLRARVRRFTRRRQRRAIGPHDEDDLVQTAWCQLIQEGGRRLHAFDPSRGVSFEGYIGVLTDRLLIDLWRRSHAPGPVPDLDAPDMTTAATESPEAQALRQRELAELWRHLDSVLPERGRAVARLLYAEHLNPTEAAQVLGVSRQVIANWTFRIRAAARAHRDEKVRSRENEFE